MNCNTHNILFITKDALARDYLPVYGNKLWKNKTPNLDQLALNGTVFNRHYTAAPSTVMAFRSMMSGKFGHEQPYSRYQPMEIESEPTDFFEIAKAKGYEGHIIWDSSWVRMVLRYGNCYGSETTIHNLDNIKQGVGCHYQHKGSLHNDEELVCETINRIVEEVKSIVTGGRKVFVWLHLPHVINGRTAYGGDIDAFDTLIGCFRGLFTDDNIFISADHGNMNGYRGKWCYGFDVNTPAIEIPLISPRIEGLEVCNDITSNVDIKTLIFDRKIIRREYVFSDCAYYAQPRRKLSIIKGNFAYIYNKESNTEELYDLEHDYYERVNLLQTTSFDTDRKVISPICEYYYSPYWNDIGDLLESFRIIRKSIWKNGTKSEELKEKYFQKIKILLVRLLVKFNLFNKFHA